MCRGGEDDLAAVFQGVMTQATRHFQIHLQRVAGHGATKADEWRPSVIMVDGRTFERAAPIQFLSWLCHRYGFGTYLHLIPGVLDDAAFRKSRVVLRRLIDTVRTNEGAIYVDTMISPSMRSALAQSLQVPGVSGMENNTILFELADDDPVEVFSRCAKDVSSPRPPT